MSSREWLEGISADLPVRPPFTWAGVDVRVGANISRGPDHAIVGVELAVSDLSDNGHELYRLGTFTAAQARALGEALITGADEADRRMWFRGSGERSAPEPSGVDGSACGDAPQPPGGWGETATSRQATHREPVGECLGGLLPPLPGDVVLPEPAACSCGCGQSEAAAAVAGAELDGCGS